MRGREMLDTIENLNPGLHRSRSRKAEGEKDWVA